MSWQRVVAWVAAVFAADLAAAVVWLVWCEWMYRRSCRMDEPIRRDDTILRLERTPPRQVS